MVKRTLMALTCLAVLAPASAARPQVSEQDRLARCANNQARLAALQAEVRGDLTLMSEEQAARAHADMMAVSSGRTTIHTLIRAPGGDGGSKAAREADRLNEVLQRNGMSPCAVSDGDCWFAAERVLDELVKRGQDALPRYQALQQQIHRHEVNLSALRCAEPSRPASTPKTCAEALPGTWSWAWASPGQKPQVHGTVTLSANGSAGASSGARGTWSCAGASVSLSWPTIPSADSLTLSADGQTLEGHNNAGWPVLGSR